MKYDDFLLKRRRRGRGREDRWLPMVCMPGAAPRTGRSGAAAPGDGPSLPLPDQEDVTVTQVGRGGTRRGCRGCQAWGHTALGVPVLSPGPPVLCGAC